MGEDSTVAEWEKVTDMAIELGDMTSKKNGGQSNCAYSQQTAC